MKCQKCQTEIPPETLFCTHCGAYIFDIIKPRERGIKFVMIAILGLICAVLAFRVIQLSPFFLAIGYAIGYYLKENFVSIIGSFVMVVNIISAVSAFLLMVWLTMSL